MGKYLVRLSEEFIQNGQLPTGINQTQIVPFPKKTKQKFMSEFRSISLCNVVYKIIAKVIANRLKPILNSIIYNN